MAESRNYRQVERDTFAKEAARITKSKLAGWKKGEFLLPTEDGEKVVEAVVWRQGLSRKVTHADVTIEDRNPQSVENNTGSYPYSRIFVVNNMWGSSETLHTGRITRVTGSQVSRNYQDEPAEELPNMARNLSRMVGKTVSQDEVLVSATELLGRIDKRKDKVSKTLRSLL